MILYQVTKYLIFDICITTFFDNICKLNGNVGEPRPEVNQFYSRIESNDGTEIFFNCRVLDVFQSDDRKDWWVDFLYEDYDLISDDEEDGDTVSVDDILREAEFDTDLSDMNEEEIEEIYDMVNNLNTDAVLLSEFKFIR